MRVRMRDVALHAGVSVKTVSNVVNGYPHIRDETRSRVLASIDSLGYRVNVSARSLRSGRTGIIALVVPEVRQPYFAELTESVIAAAATHGLTVLVDVSGGVHEREVAVFTGARQQLVDGVVFSPITLGPEDVALIDPGYPTVLLGRRIAEGPADYVAMADAEGSRDAVLHLVERGCRRIAAIGTRPEEVTGVATRRLEGYRAAHEEAGLVVDERLLVPAAPWGRADGAAAVERLLAGGVPFDGLYCFNDGLALGVLRALATAGVRVPEDVLVIGFDDTDEARYAVPSLSSVAPGREQIATASVDLLVRRFERPAAPGEHVEVVARHEVVVRDSTGGPTAP